MTWKLVGIVAFSIGCVGDGGSPDAAAEGTLGGPCFPNSTCSGNLVCALVNGKGVCQEGDASVQDAPVDQTTTDAAQDVAGDVAPVDAGCDSGLTPGAVCFGSCIGELCCPLNGQCITSGCGQTCNGTCWSCAKTSDCTNGQYCCAMSSTAQPTCPLTTNITPTTNVFCSAVPCAGGLFLCLNNSDCPTTAPTCMPAKGNGLSASTIGICQ